MAHPTAPRKLPAVLKAANAARQKWEAVCDDPNHTLDERRAAWRAFMAEVSCVLTAPVR